MDPRPDGPLSERTIFALGLTPRTGTNFLEKVLTLHPDCVALAPPIVNAQLGFESHVLEYIDLVETYVDRTSRRWGRPFSDDDGLRASTCAAMGDGILRGILGGAHDRLLAAPRLVTRFPSARNLHLMGAFFPGARAVVIIRDPRSVIDSGVRTFGSVIGRDFGASAWEGWAHHWAEGVRSYLEASRWAGVTAIQGVRYEDLTSRPDEIVNSVLGFLDLDPGLYPFDRLAELPVVGSSQMKDSHGYVHWDPAEAVDRAHTVDESEWPPSRVARLFAIAGPEIASMGYEIPRPPPREIALARVLGGGRRTARAAWSGATALLRRR